MAFQLKAKESLREGVRRNVKREIEKALQYLDAEARGHKTSAQKSETVHEVRKCFKKVRAALRLVRDEIGDEAYHEANFAFRDAARPLTELRDAEMLIETLEKLRQKYPEKIDAGGLVKAHDVLFADHRDLTLRVIGKNRALGSVKEFASRALTQLPDWNIDREGWEVLESGLRRVYRRGHQALRLAAENPSVANLHEWRKQSKYLWHVLQLLEPAWTGHEKDLGDQCHQLSRLLGEDHDLAVLRQTLAADPLAYGGHRVLKGLFVLIDLSREELEHDAFVLGKQLYKEPPKIFTGRIESYWKTWVVGSSASRTRSASSGIFQPRGIS